MKKSTFTESQILGMLRQYEGGRASDICREHGISRATLYNWRKKYAGMDGAQELKGKVKADQQGAFTIRHLYVYSTKEGYKEQLPAKVTLQVKR